MIHFHFTKLFLNQNKNSQTIEIIKNFFLENSQMQTLKGIGKVSSFTKSIFVLRNKTPYFEIVLEEKFLTIGDKKIIVYFVRSLKNIKNSLRDYIDIRDGKWLDKNPFDQNDEEDFIINYKSAKLVVPDLEKIPVELISWQNDYKLKVKYDVYESDQWISYAINNSPKDGLRVEDSKLFFNILQKIILNNEDGNLLKENQNVKFFEFHHIEFNIIVYYIKVFIGDSTYTILYAGSHLIDQFEHRNHVYKSFEETFENQFLNIQKISEFSSKAYPKWSLKNYDTWIKIQKNSELGNLSLLPEQTNFLESFKFPKYINGQAGSGKSTILYYLFSNIYYYKCAGEIKGDIVFITENKKLLEHTIDSIYELVLNNPEFLLTSDDTELTTLRKNFFSFKDFLKSFLPDAKSFPDEKYLDFSKFKYLYEISAINNVVKRKYSAEFVWFTITTYIFGLDINNVLTADQYDAVMPKEGKEIISKEDFTAIERDIVKPFFNKLLNEDQYWNKITLIKYLIENNYLNKKYEVIFCDESQDFSKIELEFIISLSLYSDYNLEDASQFPIVFAGDALQTVNPTGFRSEVLTSMIYKSLTNPLIGFNLNQKDLIFTPEFNYRSSSAIVSIANVIQNWRKNDLNEDIKDFQKPKRKDKYKNQNLNVFVDMESFNQDAEIRRKIEFKTIIVPVNNDEIDSFKEKYPVLKEFRNIISSVDAKGLDFSEVVIFGFGDHFEEHKEFGIYEKKYFYNKLYVAITRTRDELIIIDSDSAKKEFWDVIILAFLQTDWNRTILKIDNVEELLVPNTDNILQSKDSIIEEDAKQQREIGWINKNIPLLTVASNHFLKIGNYEEYFFCLGLVEEIKGDYLKASQYYLNKELVNNIDAKKKAIYALWNGKFFDRILSTSILDGVEKIVLDTLCKIYLEKEKVFDRGDIILLEENIKVLKTIKKNCIWNDEFTQLFLDNIKGNYLRDLNSSIYEILNEAFEEFVSYEDKIEIADNFYLNNQYAPALLIYEKLNFQNENYYFSKAKIAKKRRRHEEFIINLGKILYEDFAKNKDLDINKYNISKEIIEYYIDNDLEENLVPSDPYLYAYILISKLYAKEYIDDLSEYETFKNLLTSSSREVELLSFYYYLLNEEKFTTLLYNKVIVDWAKLYKEKYSLEELNYEYKILCEIKGIQYSQFSGSDTLDFIQNHIDYLHVTNFKQFSDIEINNIGLINLIVGDNNIGKTSALEMLLINNNKERYYKSLLFSYIERSKLIPDRIETSEKTEYLYEIDNEFLQDFASYSSSENPTFSFSSGKFLHKVQLLIREQQEPKDGYTNFGFSKIKKNINTLFVNEMLDNPMYTYGKGYGKDLAVFYDKYIKNDRLAEKGFLENLQLFIPNVEAVLINSIGGIDIRTIDTTVDMSLYSFGDGANKLFRILILLTIHKGKLLLIDEIDSGIHFSRFQKFWEIIIVIAKKDNTQIIATTHNLECINYFSTALDENSKDDARVIQLIRTNRLKATTYNYENFNMALEEDIELRG